MPVTTIPLVGAYTTRPGITFLSTNRDAKFIGCYADPVSDSLTQQTIPYLVKRAGLSTHSTIVASKESRALSISDDGRVCVIFSDGTVYFNSTVNTTAVNAGSMAVVSTPYITPAYLNNETYFLLSDNASNGCYYLPASAGTVVTPTFTANTNSNTTLSNVSSFTGLFVGQLLSGTNIDSSARIASMDTGASTITMTVAATGTTAGVTVTFSRLAKIIDADFPTSVAGAFAWLNGKAYIMSNAGRIYNSAINDVATYGAADFIQGLQATSLGGSGQGVVKIKDRIVGFYAGSHEFYYDAGNAFGSPLTRILSQSSNIGIFDYTQVGDNVMALGCPPGETLINAYLVTLEGVNQVSPAAVSRILSQTGSVEGCFVTGARMGGYDFFFVEGLSTAISMMYCVQTNSWYQTAFSVDFLFSGSGFSGGAYAVSRSDSVLYQLSSTAFQDGGVNFSVIVQTQLYSLNRGLPFIIDNINLIADTQSSGSTLLETTADDYANFGTVGSFDLTQQQKNLAAGGYYDTSCGFRLTTTADVPWRAQALQLTWREAA